jgi:hypothetical protein
VSKLSEWRQNGSLKFSAKSLKSQLERVKGIEPSYSAWKGFVGWILSKRIRTKGSSKRYWTVIAFPVYPNWRRFPNRPLPAVIFLLLVFAPIAASAARYFWLGDGRGNRQTEDRSSAGLLPPATEHADALIRIFAARTVRWRSFIAVHTWILVKEKGASSYSR